MSYFVRDTFAAGGSDVALSAHTGEVGATWTRHTSWSTEQTTDYNNTSAVGSGSATSLQCVMLASGTPASADYMVRGPLFALGGQPFPDIGLAGRSDPAAKTAVVVYWDDSANAVQLDEWNTGTRTSLGNYSLGSWPQFALHVVDLVFRGSTVAVQVDGVVRIGPVTTAVGAAGQVGVYVDALVAMDGLSGLHLQSLDANDILFPVDDTDQQVTTITQVPGVEVALW